MVNGLAFITDVYSAADGTDGTKIISVSNPVSMSVRSTIQHIGSPSEVYLKNSIAYLGVDGIGGFHTIDVTNPARPARLGSLRSIGATGIVVSGNTAVTTDYNNGPRTIDASNPGAPTLLATFSQMIGIDVGLLGSNPVIVGRTTGNPALPNLTVLNISNPSSPQSVGSLNLATTAGGANSIAVAGQWGFVGRDSPLTLDVINLATPGAPAKVGSLSLPGLYPHFNAVAATADANYVFAVKNSEGGGIAVVNATTKTAPVLVTTILPGSSIEAVCVSGNRLLAADNQFCYAYDISTPLAPQQLGYYQLPSGGFGIDVVGDLVYVANLYGGLQILRVKDTTAPVVNITNPTSGSNYATNSSTITLGGSASGVNGVANIRWLNNRGGGGAAQGTTDWSVANVQLTSGQNVLTVTAQDNNGNLGSRTLTVTCTLPDTTPPVVTITGPNTAAQYSVTSSTITVTGTAADDTAVSSVTWSNDRGGNGNATGVANWSIPDLQLFEGPNTITVTAQDAAGNIGTSSQFIVYAPPDTEPPAVTIAFPTSNPIYSTAESTLNISGTASDNTAITQIRWENDRGGSDWAEGTDSWFVNDIPLQNGSNTLTVTATDSGGNTGVATLTVISGSPALAINSAVSRKTHGSAGAFDINVLSGEVECRTGGPSGNHTIVVTFDNPIVSGNAAVTAGIGSVIGTPTVSGNTMTVNLTEVANAQNLTVTLNNVTDSFSHVLSDTPVSMTTLVGDTTGNKLVTSSDVSQTKLQSGQAVTTSNFREDINASGTINGTDVSIAKSNVGSGAP